MSNLPLFVGLDYHQDSIQVCVLNQQGDVLLNRSASNDCDQLARLVNPLGRVQRVGIEACCGAADLGEELVERLGRNVSLGHPAYVARIKSSPDKSDYSDGRLLADLTRVGYRRASGSRRRTSASCGSWSTTASGWSTTPGR
jgi:transposase